MDLNEQDNEVFDLLAQLRNTESIYPAEMMALRRQAYRKQMTALGIGMGAAGALKHTPKTGSGNFALPPIAGTVIESILVVAIVVESATIAYVNREKIMALFRTVSDQSTVQEVVDTPIETVVPTETLPVTSTISGTATEVTFTAVAGTPSPELLLAPNGTAGNDSGSMQTAVTPNATENNGNQYGLTPKPARTKDPANGGDTGTSPGKVPTKKP